MQKRGQFYLLTSIIIIGIILSVITLSNVLKKDDVTTLESFAEELDIEAQHVLDYTSLNPQIDQELFMIDFIEDYVNHSNINNLYFIFGTQEKIIVAANHKKEAGRIIVNDEEFEILQNTFTNQSYDGPLTEMNININGILHIYPIEAGENFYFIMADGEENGNYFFTGNTIQNETI